MALSTTTRSVKFQSPEVVVAEQSRDAADLAPASPLVFRDVDAQTAEEINMAIPNAKLPIEAARPFRWADASLGQPPALTALSCLTAAIYYEGGFEPDTGKRAIAQVVLNRVRHPAYPNSVCGVVFQGSTRTTGCQFTFTCDGSINRPPNMVAWTRSARIAREALSGHVEASVGTATHYHTIWVTPYWQSSLAKIGTIGAHVFYRWSGRTGERSAFVQAYSGAESMPSAKVVELAMTTSVGLGADEATLAWSETVNESATPPPPPVPAIAADRSVSALVADDAKGELIIAGSAGSLVVR